MPCFPGKGFVKVWLSVITYQNDVTVSDWWYHQVQILLLCTTWIHQRVVKLIDHFICTSFHLIYQAFEAPIAKKLMNFKTMRGFEIIEGGLWSLIRSQEAKKCLVYKLELKCSFYSVFCSEFFSRIASWKKFVYYFLRNNANRPAVCERRFVQNSGLLLTIPVTHIKTDYVGQSEYVLVGFHWSDSHTHCNINEEKPKMLDLNFTKPLDLTFKRSEWKCTWLLDGRRILRHSVFLL